ncbi:Gfo/Idh/MocA family protein [Haladaptatus halobius]|uniref:Gfo/Idh/MocA family protein n=1 Tax=Haladaptatus halobius TaxID=2884875 RepID=UPI001D0B79CD|nr:Gfo/Idh/MocA family oxidoreductase [Haladaptatus halobius]
MIQVGLLGAGRMAGIYADRIADLNEATVTAVASPTSAESFVTKRVPTATAYSDANELCKDTNVDAVAVLSPTDTHPELVEIAAEHELDVICEKPIARTLEGAARIQKIVESTDITFMVAHVTRFFPEYVTAKARVDDGVIGTPGVARTKRAFGFEGSRGWFDDSNRSGGILLDLAIHDFDYLRWVIGDIERVFTRRVDWINEGKSDVTLSIVRFENGAVGHVEAWAVEGPRVPFTTAFELAGSDGHLEFDLDDVRPIQYYDETGRSSPRDPVSDDLPLRRDGYHRQLEHFFECIQGGKEPSVSIEEGIASMRISLAAIESVERGKPVAVAEVGE